MIFWRSGKGGFVGAAKTLIKGFFQPQYTITTASAVAPDSEFAGRSIINKLGASGFSTMDAEFAGFSTIVSSIDNRSLINPLGIDGLSQIFEDGEDGNSGV